MREEEMIVALAGMLCVFGLPFLGCMIWLLAHYAFAALKTWHETSLKRDMVARGYSAAEIVEVISAARGGCGKTRSNLSDIPPAKPIRQPANQSGRHTPCAFANQTAFS